MDRVWGGAARSAEDRRSDPVEPISVGESAIAAGRTVGAQDGVAEGYQDYETHKGELAVFCDGVGHGTLLYVKNYVYHYIL